MGYEIIPANHETLCTSLVATVRLRLRSVQGFRSVSVDIFVSEHTFYVIITVNDSYKSIQGMCVVKFDISYHGRKFLYENIN